MRPPDVLEDFSTNTPWVQAKLISYEQVRQIEEAEIAVAGTGRGS